MQNAFSNDDWSIFISGPRDYYSFTFEVLNEHVYTGGVIGFTDI